jgi:hypothetical protein
MTVPEQLTATLRRIERSAGALATASVSRMDDDLPWFRELPADQRAWVMLVAQAGVRSLVEWLRRGDNAGGPQEVADEIFDAAPRALARSISLQQTVALIKVTIDVVEERVAHLAAPGEEEALRAAVLQFSREVAFSAARVYARAAETRGAWDARLQALLVDALLRGDSSDVVASRAAALGWEERPPVAVAVGRTPGGEAAAVLHTVYRAARRIGVEVLGGVHGDRLVVVIGGASDPLTTAEKLLAGFGDGRWSSDRRCPRWRRRPSRPGRRWPATAPRPPGRPHRARSVPRSCCRSGHSPAMRTRGGFCGRTCTARCCGPAVSCSRRWRRSSRRAASWRAPLVGSLSIQIPFGIA